ncbi:bactofilin family protein [Mongoliitalea daihaiensis]|uniref:bactofilin family protein n=1 Tax=Mongoliitalea daihaiensis TaxID=2782006 RepID=UPI001F20B006|nr:polymer-forming cytoskeletal protein [Mongoliitalea daihaiensis]UJP66285.1 polymer-forming cytoskeletal protein [Mongoliitalea daihaiensis]
MFGKSEEKSIKEIVNSSNVISKETNITGNITAQGNIRIEGTIEGRIDSKSKIVIGDSALIKGDLKSVEAEIAGKVNGSVTCEDLLYLKSTAIIEGDIFTAKIVIENGAQFNGKCQMKTSGMKVSKQDVKNEQKIQESTAG